MGIEASDQELSPFWPGFGVMKSLVKTAARLALGEYSLYRIYQAGPPTTTAEHPVVRRLTEAEIAISMDPLIAQQAWYGGEGSECFALLDDDAIAVVCFYWFGDRYKSRGFWPLAPSEAKLVQIVTAPAFRGRGLATTLIRTSACLMSNLGYRNLFARVWHSNDPSWKAFERAGWRRIASVAELNPLRLAQPWRLRWRCG